MAAKTEKAKIDDVVRVELPNNFCREVHTVLDGEVISLGEICKLNSASKMIACTAGVDEKQTLTEADGTDGGTFRVKYKEAITDALAWDISAANMQTALRALHADLSTCTVALATQVYTVTVPNADIPAGPGIDLLEIVNDCTADGGVWEGGVIVERTQAGHLVGGDAEAIALEAASPSGADGSALFMVRGPAIVDKAQLTVPTGGTAGAVAALKLKDILALAEPVETSELE